MTSIFARPQVQGRVQEHGALLKARGEVINPSNRLMRYNWQQKNWPAFTFDLLVVEEKLHRYAEEVAFLTGRMSSFADELRYDLIADNLATEALYNSQIEGVRFSVEELKSSRSNQPTMTHCKRGLMA